MVTTRPPKTIVKPMALGPVVNTDTKLLIYGLFQKGRVLAQDGMEFHIGAGVTEQEDPELYKRVSPVAWVEHLRAPLLIIHSDRDLDVAPGMTCNLVDELERQHKAHEVVIYPGEGHGLADPAHQLDSYRRILFFLDRHLKP